MPSQTERRTNTQLQMAYFKEVFSDSGIALSDTDKPNTLTREQSLVIRDMEKVLENHISYPANIDEFIFGLERLCKQENDFRKALIPTQLVKGSDVSENQINQESVFRILLRVNCLQKRVMDLVLEKLTAVAIEDDDTGWLKLFLNALRYLPFVKDATNLTMKLLDILEVATLPAQSDILGTIPEIIPDEHHGHAAEQLTSLLDQNSHLSGAIIDCLLTLNTGTNTDMQDRILSKMFSESYFKIYPIVYECLVAHCPAQRLPHILQKIRNALDMVMTSTGNDSDTNKLLLLEKLESSATCSRAIFDAWVALISNIKAHSDHSPVDLLILYMLHRVLHATGSARKKVVENVFKKKVKSGLFKDTLIEKFFEKYLTVQITKNYLDSIINVAYILRHVNDTKTMRFVTVVYKTAFNHDFVDCGQHQDILHSVMSLHDPKTLNSVFTILKELVEDVPNLRKHTVQLMGLLEIFDSLSTQNAKDLFEILCPLTCDSSDDSMSGFKDELHMLVRKGASSCKKSTKHKCIVAAVVMAKHIACTDLEQSDLSDDESDVSLADLPEGVARDAASLLEMIDSCVSGCPESAGLYYDQLAQMLVDTKHLDKYFMSWLHDSMTKTFQNTFVGESNPEPANLNDVSVSIQYSLNTGDEIDRPIYINIAEQVLISHEDSSILALAPLFRLVRMLHYKQNNGNLSSIDALLGCGVLLPILDDITIMDADQIKQAADCVFHCINWFRETINAFVNQRGKHLQRKLIARLDHIVELEEILNSCLDNVEHTLPASYYDMPHKQIGPTKPESRKTVKRPAKRFKSNALVNETAASVSDRTESTKASTRTTATATAREREFRFREFDTDVMLLLKYPLKLNDTVDLSQSTSTQPVTLNIKQFYFILKDMVMKMKVLLHGSASGLSHFNSVKPLDVVKDFQGLLPNINKSFKRIVQEIKGNLEDANGVLDAPQLFTPEMCDLKRNFVIILDCFYTIFSWQGFENTKNLNILKDCLRKLQEEQISQIISTNRLSVEFCRKLYNVRDHCLLLTSATNLIKTMQVLHNINANADLKKMIWSTAGDLLQKKWYNLKGTVESGKSSHAEIDFLVKAYLDGANVNTLSGLVGTLQKQASQLASNEDCLQMLASVTKANFHVFFKCLCQALQQRVQSEVASLTNNEHLVLWKETALTLQGLMTVVKIHETRPNLTSFMKRSVGVLKLFLSHGLPILEIMLRSKPDEVVEILKAIQITTRFLHHLCCHSKLMKDTCLMAYVPQFRLTLEMLVYRVKAALVANNCKNAFWMGNLKNKNLHGEEILSQDSTTTENNESSEEELPDDSSDDDLVDDDNESGRGTSASEVF